MPNGAYWKKRFELLEQKQNQIGAQCFSDIEKQFKQAQKQLEGQLLVWYQRLADNNGISMQEAKKWLSTAELEEFKWDVNQYIQHGKENAVNGQWVKQLENASAKYHISRLEALKIQIQQSIETLFGNQLDSIDRAMKNVYRSGYYHTAFEIQKGFNIGWDFAKLDNRRIAKVINTPWAADGKNFSARVWDNRTKLINEMNTELTRNIITGADPQKAIDAIARKMKTSKNNAGRLVMTEEAFFSSAAQKDCFTELDVEQFEVVATLDSHTSDICRDMDGRKFKMSEWEIGVTAPPFHVYCRSTTVPYFDDDLGSIGERAARGEDGKTYYVPANMTYKEWEKCFVGDDKSGLAEIPRIPDETIRMANEEFSQILIDSKLTPCNDKMILYNGATEYKLNGKLEAPFAYNPQLDVIEYNPSAPNYSLYDMNFVQAHELSHRMDELEYHSWENEKFLHAIENTKQKIYDNADKIVEWFSYGGKYDNDMALSDIISALSGGKMNDILYSGHPVEYWQESRMNVCKEIFANMVSIDVMDYTSKVEFNGILKEIYDAYKEIVE